MKIQHCVVDIAVHNTSHRGWTASLKILINARYETNLPKENGSLTDGAFDVLICYVNLDKSVYNT